MLIVLVAASWLVVVVSACTRVEEIERTVEVEREVTVEKLVTVEVEKRIDVPVTVEVERQVLVEKVVTVEVEKLVEVPVEVPVPYQVEVPAPYEVEVPVTVEVEKMIVVEREIEVPVTVEVEKTIVVEREIEVPVTVEVEKTIVVEKEIYVPVTVEVPVPTEIERQVIAVNTDEKEREEPLAPALSVVQDFDRSLNPDRWIMLGSTEHHLSKGTVQLTNTRNWQSGLLLHRHPIRWRNSNIKFSFEISGGSGADGLGLVLLESIPDFEMFADRLNFPSGAYWASFHLDGYLVAFDTYWNGKGYWRNWYYPVDDPSANFVALVQLGSSDGQSALDHVATANVEQDLRNSGTFDAEVLIDGDGNVEIYLANADADMDKTLVIRSSITDFAGSLAYIGFVANTGDLNDRHVIHSLKYE